MNELMSERYTSIQIGDNTSRSLTPSSGISWEQQLSHGPLDSFKFWQIALGETRPAENFVLTEDDVKATFAPLKLGEEDSEYRSLGCEHYKRNVKIQCFDCNRWHTCRHCHDERENHHLNRKKTRSMLCMLCATPQPAAEFCRSCQVRTAWYYCDICKLWDNDSAKSIYHCPDCGICRRGEGLGKDFIHCKVCSRL